MPKKLLIVNLLKLIECLSLHDFATKMFCAVIKFDMDENCPYFAKVSMKNFKNLKIGKLLLNFPTLSFQRLCNYE